MDILGVPQKKSVIKLKQILKEIIWLGRNDSIRKEISSQDHALKVVLRFLETLQMKNLGGNFHYNIKHNKLALKHETPANDSFTSNI